MNNLKKTVWAKLAAVVLIILSISIFTSSCVLIIYSALDGVYDSNTSFFGSDLCNAVVMQYYNKYCSYITMLYKKDDLEYSGENIEIRLKRYEEMFSKENCNLSITIAYHYEGGDTHNNYEVEEYVYQRQFSQGYSFGEPMKTVTLRIGNDLVKGDLLYYYYVRWNALRSYGWLVIIGAIVSFATTILGFVGLCTFAGYSKKNDGARIKLVDRIPFELSTLVSALLIGVAFPLAYELMYNIDHSRLEHFPELMLLVAVAAAVIIVSLLSAYLATFARRVKCKKFFRTTILYYVVCAFKYVIKVISALVRNIPGFIKSVALVFFLGIIDLFTIIVIHDDEAVGLGFLLHFLFFVALLYFLLCLGNIRKGIKKLSKGDLSDKVNDIGTFGSIRSSIADLNSLGDGMQEAVSRQMKSERLKTELITNVSHDIKTPLTSIVNYVDLLKKEEIENETANEYIEVLDRQSSRMKKLLDDLVDASKAQSGCITVNRETIDLGELLKQTVGEYTERLEKAGLTPVVEETVGNVKVSADGRLMWRVFDNLLGNVCKYSLEGTRVYVGVKEKGGKCEVSIRNISKNSISIADENELFERFVRGDSSRNTEGSGLGLSIAKSLVELQGGRMELKIDSDLFRVTMFFPSLISG